MKMSKFTLLVLALAAVLFGSAVACTCVWEKNATVRSHAKSMDSIFKGEFLGEQRRRSVEFGELVAGEFRVIETLKGESPTLIELEYLVDDGANCGIRLEIGVVYEVFAYESDGVLRTDECSGTRKADSGSKRWSWKRYRKALRK